MHLLDYEPSPIQSPLHPSSNRPLRAATPCGRVASSRPLQLGRGRQPLAAWPRAAAPCTLATAGRACGRLLSQRATALCRWPSHSWPPPCRGPWLQHAAPTRGLAVAMPGCPLQRLPWLQKCSKNV
ncbi:hypothetical protein GW17_00056668 [Ensete ventricosum]|nr:hypothetical protein GW17_00056668 [Ensete ventricosum]